MNGINFPGKIGGHGIQWGEDDYANESEYAEVKNVIDTIGSGDTAYTEVFNDVSVDTTSAEFPRGSLNYAYIRVDKMSRGDIEVEGSSGGSVWEPITVTSISTGDIFSRINNDGYFVCSVFKYTNVRLKLALRPEGSATCSIKFTAIQEPRAGVDRVIVSEKYPVPAIPNSEIKYNKNNGIICCEPYMPQDTIYGNSGSYLLKSTNNGDNFALLGDIYPAVVQKVFKTENGNILVFLLNGECYSYDEDTDIRTLVHTTESANTSISATLGGLHVYKNYVFYAEYGTNNQADNPRRCYMSNNYGLVGSWSKIFEGPLNSTLAVGTWHLHAIQFDPYENILWVANGDGSSNANIWYSDDWLSTTPTWNKVYDDGLCPNQFTTIYPLPNCVLFGTDNRTTGYWKYNRLKNGIKSSKVSVEPSLELYRHFNGSEPIAKAGRVDYDVPAVYFSFYVKRDEATSPPSIIATADGENFYTIFTAPHLSQESSNSFLGITVTGRNANGQVLADWYNREDGAGTARNVIFIDPIVWEDM